MDIWLAVFETCLGAKISKMYVMAHNFLISTVFPPTLEIKEGITATW